MKHVTQIALVVALLASGCRSLHPRERLVPGRWQVAPTPAGNWLVTDTATGHAWYGEVKDQYWTITWHALTPPTDER